MTTATSGTVPIAAQRTRLMLAGSLPPDAIWKKLHLKNKGQAASDDAFMHCDKECAYLSLGSTRVLQNWMSRCKFKLLHTISKSPR